MSVTQRCDWLRQHTVFAALSDEALQAIAAVISVQRLAENQRLAREDTQPTAVYILQSGHLESYRTSATSMAQVSNLLPGSVVYLREVLLAQPLQETTVALGNVVVWAIPAESCRAIAHTYPAVNQLVSQQLADQLQEMSAELEYERDRQVALRPYLVNKVQRGIVGTSRYAMRLRQAIKQANGDRESVLIFGEPGLEKDNVAGLIHFGSPWRKLPFVKVDCNLLQANGADLFGRVGGKAGLLEWVGEGTLLLNNFELLPSSLDESIAALLATQTYVPVARAGDDPPATRTCDARIIMVSEKMMPCLDQKDLLGHTIKVPPLRVRKSDIAAQTGYYLSLLCRSKVCAKPRVTPEALRRLQGYDFPGNLRELEALLDRALTQAECATELTEELLWATGEKTQRFRWNLLNAYPQLRRFLRSAWYPDRINYGFTVWVFPIVVAVLLFGPQTRDQNVMLNFFWDWWWLGSCLIFPFLGRIWCTFCPFMIYGEISQKLSQMWFPGTLRSWPRQAADQVGGWFIFGLFTLILLWEELWHLENVAYLSGCLLLLITAGAMIFSALFERRFWCRYLCPIGGMNGLFAKLSMTELRAQQGICSASCNTYQCYKGGPEKGEGQETGGCPVYSHPAQLQENKDCVLCMTCLKACPHRSVGLNLRPPGIELWTTHKPVASEVALLFLLFGAVFLHRLPQLESLLNIDLHLSNFGWHSLVSIVALLIPALVALPIYGLMRWRRQCRSFVELAYGYLPLVLGGTMAHYW
ncbi:cyclic nucleotide-binding domain-containing protein, partial [filamentous cyanobacterium LEGE 11480]|nr:cyclic nucleotide-binding domain-containing protein [Romeriopsis navalis LEGE 11480]